VEGGREGRKEEDEGGGGVICINRSSVFFQASSLISNLS